MAKARRLNSIMASGELTGWTQPTVSKKRHDHESKYDFQKDWEFDEKFCLAEIRRQPEDYDGPQRYCGCTTLLGPDDLDGRRPRCRFHDGNSADMLEDMGDDIEKGEARAIKHGMYAEDSNLKEDFSEADQKLYEQIMAWAEGYGFEEGSPAYLQLESLALSKVREMRGEVYLQENGEIQVESNFDPISEEMIETEETHPLKNDLRLQKQTILKMMSSLGLTPKSASQMNMNDSSADESDAIAEMAEEALDDGDYNPDQFGSGS